MIVRPLSTSSGIPGDGGFIEWAKKSRVPLSTVKAEPPWDDLALLGEMIGDARVVALSEAVHCAAEPLEFRNRVFQYLAQEKGFTAIAIESGFVEGRIVHDYVRGGPGKLNSVATQGISWGGDRLPQNHALISWMREFNACSTRSRKINFYGFDVSGSPAGPFAHRGCDTALREVLKYLQQVDIVEGRAFKDRTDSLMKRMQFTLQPRAGDAGYECLSQVERNNLTAAIVDLISLLERKEARYVESSSAAEYQWAYRAAIGAGQIDNWLRRIPIGWRASSSDAAFREALSFFAEATNVRDRAQADNVDWILREEGSAGKVLIFAARYHLCGTTVSTRFVPETEEYGQEVAGSYLRRRLGDELVTIGHLIGHGNLSYAGHDQILEWPPPHSVDALAAEVGEPMFLLDVRAAPTAARNWLNQQREFVTSGQTLKLPLSQAFDILFYTETVTPAGWMTSSAA